MPDVLNSRMTLLSSHCMSEGNRGPIPRVRNSRILSYGRVAQDSGISGQRRAQERADHTVAT